MFHAPLIAATPGLTVATVVTSDPERRDQVHREHPEARVADSVEELWELPGHDLLVIAAPNRVHSPIAAQAIDRDVAVVVDKPLARSADEAEALVLRAERGGVLLTVFQNRRWDSDHLTLERLLAEDRLGQVMRYESRIERWRPSPNAAAWREASSPDEGGGLLLDLGSHLVDQALVLFGAPTSVYAEIQSRRALPGDDDVFLALRHDGGVISHLRASAVTAAPGPRLRVLGSEAAFVVGDVDSQEDRLRAGQRPNGGWGEEPESSWGRLVRGDDSVVVPSERGDWLRFYALLAAALRGKGVPPVDPRDAVATLGVLDAARQSAATGSVIGL